MITHCPFCQEKLKAPSLESTDTIISFLYDLFCSTEIAITSYSSIYHLTVQKLIHPSSGFHNKYVAINNPFIISWFDSGPLTIIQSSSSSEEKYKTFSQKLIYEKERASFQDFVDAYYRLNNLKAFS